MRTTLNIDDRLIEEAAKVTGTSEKTKLVKMSQNGIGGSYICLQRKKTC